MEKVMPSFKKYITQRYGSYPEFIGLKTTDKEKVFLRYKWGFSEDRANQECEMTRRNLYTLIKDFSLENIKHTERKEFFKKLIDWEDYCFEVKKEIGLISVNFKDEPEIVKSAREIFGTYNPE